MHEKAANKIIIKNKNKMSKSKNKVSLIGIIGKDAMAYKTQGGVPYTRFSLATSKGGYKKADGTEVPEVTQWHNIICWRGLAEVAAKYVKKGMKVAVDGEIVYGYYDKQGVTCMSIDIVADDVVMMSRPKDEAVDMSAPEEGAQQPEPTPKDDLPF